MKDNPVKGQSSLEIALVLVAVLLFLLGMVRIFFWGNTDLIKRQKDYLKSRGIAGTWPVHRTSSLSDGNIF